MMEVTDQMGNKLVFAKTPKRIISLVPSQTELLYDLGLTPIGQTVFCIHPADKFKSATKIGGTKKLQLNKIIDLKPDIIIGNKEENTKEDIEFLQSKFPVWMSDVNSLSEGLAMIESIGKIFDKEDLAKNIVNNILLSHKRLNTQPLTNNRVLYLIWKDPYFGVASNTFIHDILVQSGFENVLINQERYPELSQVDIEDLNPDHIFLSTEPYPFKEVHQREFEKLLPSTRVHIVDGEMFSWYGSRLLKSSDYIYDLIQSCKNYENQSR